MSSIVEPQHFNASEVPSLLAAVDLGVERRGGHRGVAEELLDLHQVPALLQEHGRRAVAQVVRGRRDRRRSAEKLTLGDVPAQRA
jgi:hypothetical protein